MDLPIFGFHQLLPPNFPLSALHFAAGWQMDLGDARFHLPLIFWSG